MIRKLLLALCLLVWPAAAEARWREASGRHFVIYSEQNEADLRRFAEQLERFDRALRVQLQRPDPDRSPATRLTIYVLSDVDELQRFLGAEGVAGVYFGRVSGSTAFTFQPGRERRPTRLSPRIVLFHEYTHHFLYNNFSFGAPLWFSEGYPEFWSTVDFEADGSVRVGLPAMHRNMELTQGRPMRVQELLNVRPPVRDGETYVVTYGRGWLLSHFLSFNQARRGQLDAYLRALGEGRTPEQAAEVFGDLAQLDRDLTRYFDSARFSYATIPAAQLATGPIAIRELSAGEAAIFNARMRSKRGVTARQAGSVAAQARGAAEPYPNDANVQVALAEAEYDAGNFAQAEAAADRALAANPNLVDAHLYKGRAIWGRIAAAGNATPAQWREVQRWLQSANRLDPDDPEPLALFYQSFGAANMPPTANAIAGLTYAYELAPEDKSLRIVAGRQFLASGNAARAREALAPVAADGHSGTLANDMAEVLAILARGDTAAARARLDAAIARGRAQQ